MAVDSGGYWCTNKLRALTVAWLISSQRSRNGVQLNRSARKSNGKRLEQTQGLNTALYMKLGLNTALCMDVGLDTAQLTLTVVVPQLIVV